MNDRRKLLVALGAIVIAAPLSSFAQQQGKIWRVGFLALRRVESLDIDFFGGFPQGMRKLGYIEGKNLVIEWRSADGKLERLAGLASELLELKVDVILAAGTAAAKAAQQVTNTVPIVFAATNDPVGSGIVVSLARPGGNATGLSTLTGDISAKHFEMLLSMVPKLSRVAVLVHPKNVTHPAIFKDIQVAGEKVGVKALAVEASTAPEIDKIFSVIAQEKATAIIVLGDPVLIQQRRQIAELATKYRLPSVGHYREFVEAGGLIGYGTSHADNYRGAATYVDKIFKGAKPGDLPVEQPTKFELVINGRTAKALGLTIPQSLRISADKVIE
jgi:putative ABC transport system substrate-binding protein